MSKKIVTAAEAVAKIQDEAFVAISGVNVAGVPLELLDALIERHKREGHPSNLSYIHAGGNFAGKLLADEGMLGTYYSGIPMLGPEYVDANVIPTYSLSQGICVQLYRAQAADYPYLTKAGLHTFIDPRVEGGCANAKAAEKPIVDLVEVGGEEYLHIKIPPIKVALIRATTADCEGNLTNEEEAVKHELLYLAMAAHNNGGIVIAQVKNLAKFGTLNAADIKVPGMLVDYVVVCSDKEKWHPQSGAGYYEAGLDGHFKVDESRIPFESWAPTGERLTVARRASQELWPGCIGNVGIGASAGVAYVVAKENVHDMIYLTVELGAIGGYTGDGRYFSTAFNARSYLQHHEMFDFYNGHGLDITFLGAAEVGEDGSVNVTKIAGRTNGSGGFVNIASSTKKIVFVTTLTVGGASVWDNGALKVVKEAKQPKFIPKVDQISFNGKEAVRKGQDVTYVTERAVFKLINGKVTLVEYAPGLDIEKDILANMGFRPEIAPDLQPMPSYCFTDEKIGLREAWEKRIAEED